MRILGSIVSFSTLSVLAQTWTQLPDFPGTPRDDAASFTLNGKIYVGTGLDAGFALTNDWFAYDESDGTWHSIASLPSTGRQYCAAFAQGDSGYVFGGVDQNGPLDQLWRYDPASDQWAQRASLPAAGRYASVAFGGFDKSYICTGMLDGGIPTNEVWCYDAILNTWTSRAPVPGASRHRACQAAFGVIGGADATSQALADGYSYNPITNAWSPLLALPEARFGARGNDNLIIAGASSATEVHADAWFYSPFDNDWTSFLVPDFAGGPRRDGVIGGSNVQDAAIWYYGTGSDNTQRFHDWWRLDLPVGMTASLVIPHLCIFPNPAIDHITVRTPGSMWDSSCQVIDGTGRIVLSTTTQGNEPISVAHLAPGRYEVVARNSEHLWRSPLIKLP